MLDAVARTLDWRGIAQQPVEEKRESVRKLLQSKRYLLVVDNFETITDESIRDFLLKLPEPSKAMITSREQKLPQAWAVSIKGLEQNEALILIRNEGQRLGLKSIENAEELVLIHLYKATGGAPLAIKWAVGQIKQKGQSLDTVLSALYEAKGDIFEQVFARSWSLLTEDAKKVLMVMPIFASSASKDAIEAGSDVHHFALDEALGQLVQMWLVEVTDELEASKRRYSVHSLTRAFGLNKLKDDITFQENSMFRINKFYLEFVKRYGGKSFKFFDFLEVEKDNIFFMIDWSYQAGKWQNVIELMKCLGLFLGFRGFWESAIHYSLIALESAKKINDFNAIAIISSEGLGWFYYNMCNYNESKKYAELGLYHAKKFNDYKKICSGKRLLGWIAREEGRLSDSKSLIQDNLLIAEREKFETHKNALFSDYGELEVRIGNYREGEAWYNKSLNGFQKLGRREKISKRFLLLGEVLLLQNRLDESLQSYQKSLFLSHEYKRYDFIARIKLDLARLNEIKRDYKEAFKLANEALISFQKLGMKKYIKEAEEMINSLEKKLKINI